MPDDIKLIPPGAATFSDRDVLAPQESDEGPGVLGTIKDVGLGMARTGIGAVRSLGTVPGRMLEEQPGWVTEADQGLRHIDETLEGWQSQRARNAEKAKLFPGSDDYRASDMPVAYTLHHIANLAPWIVGGAIAGTATGLSGGAAAPVIGAALWSALSGGDYIKQAYDTADKAPIQALQQLPKWNQYVQEAGGSEAGARAMVAKDMIDGRALALNMAVGAVPGMVMGKGANALGQMIKPTVEGAKQGVIRAGTVGAAEGVGGLTLQSGVLDVTGQVGEQNVGLRKDIDYEQTTGRMLESVAPGLMLGGLHAGKAALNRQPSKGAIDTGEKPPTTVDTTENGQAQDLALNDTLNGGQRQTSDYDAAAANRPFQQTPYPSQPPVDMGPLGGEAPATPVAPRPVGAEQVQPVQRQPVHNPAAEPREPEPTAIEPVWRRNGEETPVKIVGTPVAGTDALGRSMQYVPVHVEGDMEPYQTKDGKWKERQRVRHVPMEELAQRSAPNTGFGQFSNIQRPGGGPPDAPRPARPEAAGRPTGEFARQRGERGGEWTPPESYVDEAPVTAELPAIGAPVRGAIDVNGQPVSPQMVGSAGMARERRGGDRSAVQMPGSWDLMNQRARERSAQAEEAPPTGPYWKHPRLGNVPVRIMGGVERGQEFSRDRFEGPSEFDAVKVRPEGGHKDGRDDVVVPLDQLVIPPGTRRAGGGKAPVTPAAPAAGGVQPTGKASAGQTAAQQTSRGTAVPPALAALKDKIARGAPMSALEIREATVLERLRAKGAGTSDATGSEKDKLKALRDAERKKGGKGSDAAPAKRLGNSKAAADGEAPVTEEVTGAAPRETLRLKEGANLDRIRAQIGYDVGGVPRMVDQTVPLGEDVEGRWARRDETNIRGAKPKGREEDVVRNNKNEVVLKNGEPVKQVFYRGSETTTTKRDPNVVYGKGQAGTRPVPARARQFEAAINEVKGENASAAAELTEGGAPVHTTRKVEVVHKSRKQADRAAKAAAREQKRRIMSRKARRVSKNRGTMETAINDLVDKVRRGASLQSIVDQAKDLMLKLEAEEKAGHRATQKDREDAQRKLREEVTRDTFEAAYGEASNELMTAIMTAATNTRNVVAARAHAPLAANATSAPGSPRTIFQAIKPKKNSERVQYENTGGTLLKNAQDAQAFARKIIERVDAAWEASGKAAGSMARIWKTSENRSGGPDAPWFSAAVRTRKFIETIDRLQAKVREKGEVTPYIEKDLREALQEFGDLVALGAEEAHKTRRLKNQELTESKTQTAYQKVGRAYNALREREAVEGSRDDAEGAPAEGHGEKGLDKDDAEANDYTRGKKEREQAFADDSDTVGLEEAMDVADTSLMDGPRADQSEGFKIYGNERSEGDGMRRQANERHDKNHPDHDHRDPEMQGKIGSFTIDDLPNDPETLRRAAESVAQERRQRAETALDEYSSRIEGEPAAEPQKVRVLRDGKFVMEDHQRVLDAPLDADTHTKLVAEAANKLAAKLYAEHKTAEGSTEAALNERVIKDAAGKRIEFSTEVGSRIHNSIVRALNDLAEYLGKRPLKLAEKPKGPSPEELRDTPLEAKVGLGWPLYAKELRKLEEWAARKVTRTPEEIARQDMLATWQAKNAEWKAKMMAPRKSVVDRAMRDRRVAIDELEAIRKGMTGESKETRTAREAVEKLVELHGLIALDPRAQKLRDRLAPVLRQFHVWQEARSPEAIKAALEQIRKEEAELAARMPEKKELPEAKPADTFTDTEGYVHEIPAQRPDNLARPIPEATAKLAEKQAAAKAAEEKAEAEAKAKAKAEREAAEQKAAAAREEADAKARAEAEHLLSGEEVDPTKTSAKVRDAADELSNIMRGEGVGPHPPTAAQAKAVRMQPVNWAFTRIARKLIKNVKTVEVTPEVMRHLIEARDPTGARDALAFYDWKTDRIFTRVGVSARNYGHVMRHEVVHAITDGAFHRDPRMLRKLNVLRQLAHERYVGASGDTMGVHDMYGLRSSKEFLAEALSNPEFQAYLAGIKLTRADAMRIAGAPKTTMLEAAAHLIRNVLNRVFGREVAEESLLGRTLDEAFALFEHARREGRPKWDAGDEATVSYLKGLDDFAQSMKDAREHVRGARGLWLHTFDQLAGRGRQIYQNLTKPYFETWSNMNHFAQEEMRKPLTRDMIQAVGKLYKLPEGVRDKAFDLLIRADAHPLDPRFGIKEGPNEKIFREKGYAHEQARQEHDRLKRDLEEADKNIAGFKEAYERIDAWAKATREREREVSALDVVEKVREIRNEHDEVDPVAQSALWKQVLGKKNMTPEEQAWIDARRMPDDVSNDAAIQRAKFDRFVNGLRQSAHLEKLNGFWLPRSRNKGDWVVSGHWSLPEPENGTKIKSTIDPTMDSGRVEFNDEREIPAYIKKITEMGLTQLGAGRTVYNPDGSVAYEIRPAQTTVMDGPINSQDYVKVERKTETRMTPAELEREIKEAGSTNKTIRHWITVGNVHMQRVEGEMEARRVYERLRAEKPALNVKGVEHVRDFSKGFINQHLMNTQLSDLIKRTKGSAAFMKLSEKQQNEVLNELQDQAARTIAATGGRSPFLGRRYATGMDRDLLHTLATAATRAAHRIGHATYANELAARGAAIEKHLREQAYSNTSARDLDSSQYLNDHALESEVWREMQKRVYETRNNSADTTWDKVTNRLMQMTYTAKLAGTSFLMINALEAAVIGLPIMAGKYGAADSVRMMHRMYNTVGGYRVMKTALGDFKRSWKEDFVSSDMRKTIHDNIDSDRRLSAEKKAQYKEAIDDFIKHGLLDPEAVNELTLLRQDSSNRLGKFVDKADIAMRTLNGGVESMNRAVLGLSAFELELAKSKGDVKAALRAGREMILAGAGNAAAWNAPPIMNNRYLRPALQFKKYPQRILGNYIKAASHALDKTPEGAEARKKLMYMLAMQASVAGLAGLPTEPLTVPLNAMYLTGLSPVNADDVKAQLQKKLVEMGGKDFGEYTMHGLLRATGTGIGSRLSQSDLVTYGSLKDTKTDTALLGLANMVLGAPGGTVIDALGGIKDVAKGFSEYNSGAREQGLDRALAGGRKLMFIRQAADIYDAFAGAADGNINNETAGGKRVRTQLTPGEQLVTALGLRPARVENRQLARRVEQRELRQENEARNSWVQAYARANPTDRLRLRQAIQDKFNAGRPQDQWITFSDLQRGVASYERNQRQSPDQLGLTFNRKNQHINTDWNKVFNL